MKFEIDTKNKTIELKDDVNLCELVQELKDLLDTDWQNYTLIIGKGKTEYITTTPIFTPPNPNIHYWTDPDNPYTINY